MIYFISVIFNPDILILPISFDYLYLPMPPSIEKLIMKSAKRFIIPACKATIPSPLSQSPGKTTVPSPLSHPSSEAAVPCSFPHATF